MTDKRPDFRRMKWWGLLVCLPIVAGSIHLHLPSFWGGFIGDSAVYYAMSDSLAHDFDLQYTHQDLLRITSEWPGGPDGILLVADRDNPSVIHYAKPFIYSLAAAPLVRLLSANGLLLFNALCFTALVFMGFLAFPTRNGTGSPEAILWSIIFWGLSAVPAYVFSLTPDLFNGTLLMAGLILWVRHKQTARPIRTLWISTLVISIAATSRPPNALFLLLPFWSLAFMKTGLSQDEEDYSRVKSFFQKIYGVSLLTTAAGLGFGLSYLSAHFLTGQGFAYSGFRKRVVGHFPFETPDLTFLNTGNPMSTETTKFVFNADTLFHNLYYFFTGRFGGLIPYFFPAFITLILAFCVLRRKTDDNAPAFLPSRTPLWIVLAGLYIFHIVYIPSNWHGGSCAVGSRYLISWLPGFYILLRKPPTLRLSVVTAGITALFTGLIAISPATAFLNYRDIPKRPIMKMFPMEITLLESWPVDDLKHRRVDYGSYFLYFSDDNQFGKENEGFWVKGRSTTDLVMRCWKPEKKVIIKIRNGGKPSRIKGYVGSDSFSMKVEAGEYREISLDPGRPVKAYNLAGNASYCYPVKISVSSGFIPRFSEAGSTDHRFLGCHIILETNP